MKIGSLLYATDSGLGIQAKAFVDNGIITDPMIVEHHHHKNHMEWYPGARHTPMRAWNLSAVYDLIHSIDILLQFETPYLWHLMDYCRQHGVKTAICVNYECHQMHRGHDKEQPDIWLCPSLLDLEYFLEQQPPVSKTLSEVAWDTPFYIYPGWPKGKNKATFAPVPVDVKWTQRTKAQKFVHHGGHLGMKGRNGTKELIQALEFVKSAATIVISSQEYIGSELETIIHKAATKVDVHYAKQTVPYDKLWDAEEGDVLVHPHKWDGLSLPLQEARAAGLLVMSTDRFPDNSWLPKEPLIHVDHYERDRVGASYNEIDVAIIRPEDIAQQIDGWYGKDISAYSLQGKEWAQSMSWNVLKPKYLQLFEGLLACK